MFPIQITPEQLTQELAAFNRQLLQAVRTLGDIREAEIQSGVSKKDAIDREDKLVLIGDAGGLPRGGRPAERLGRLRRW